MFVLPAIAFVGGLVAMGRTKPQTTVRKLLCLGPISGLVYNVEELPEVGSLIVRAPGNQAIAQFLRVAMREPGKPGLVYQQGQGDAQLLAAMRKDFAQPAPKLAPVSAPATTPMTTANGDNPYAGEPELARALTDAERKLVDGDLIYKAPELLTPAGRQLVRARRRELGREPVAAGAPPTVPPKAPQPPKAQAAGRGTP